MSFNGFLDLSGTPSLIATDGNKLVLGTQGNQDIEFIRNGQTVFRVTDAGVIAQFDLPNNVWLQTRNAANTADLNLLRANSSDNTELNVGQANGAIRFTINGILASSVIQIGGTQNQIRLTSPNQSRTLSLAAVDSGTPFFGTTTNHALELGTNNLTRLTLAADGSSLAPSSSDLMTLGTDTLRFISVLVGNATYKMNMSYSAGEAAGVIGTVSNHAMSFRSNGITRLTLAADGTSLIASQQMLIATSGAQALNLGVSGIARWGIDTAASWVQAAGGGNIVMTVGSTSLRQPTVTGITAAGTNSATATALSAVINNVTTVASGTGVRLWAAGIGSVIHVRNGGANALLVYPNTGGTINGGGVDVGVSIAVGAIGTFMVTASNTWIT